LQRLTTDSIKMGDIMRNLLISVSVTALMMSPCANATETVTYSYDTQGRLVQSVISGTVNNGQTSSTTFDAANNRTNYNVSLSGGTPPTPPPPPPPAIVALNPSYNLASNASLVIALSTLANTNGQAATINSFTPATTNGSAIIASGGQSVTYTAPVVPKAAVCEPATTINFTVPYGIKNTTTSVIVIGEVSFSVTGAKGGIPSGGCP
jgi:YD repeat-containing protein